jgi:hypothetical protein
MFDFWFGCIVLCALTSGCLMSLDLVMVCLYFVEVIEMVSFWLWVFGMVFGDFVVSKCYTILVGMGFDIIDFLGLCRLLLDDL